MKNNPWENKEQNKMKAIKHTENMENRNIFQKIKDNIEYAFFYVFVRIFWHFFYKWFIKPIVSMFN